MRGEKKIEGQSRKAEPGGHQRHLAEPEELMSREQPEGQRDAENTQLLLILVHLKSSVPTDTADF